MDEDDCTDQILNFRTTHLIGWKVDEVDCVDVLFRALVQDLHEEQTAVNLANQTFPVVHGVLGPVAVAAGRLQPAVDCQGREGLGTWRQEGQAVGIHIDHSAIVQETTPETRGEVKGGDVVNTMIFVTLMMIRLHLS